jgi:hypothetical protein
VVLPVLRTWEDLADLPAPESLAVIDEVAAGMDIPGANVNALFAVCGLLAGLQRCQPLKAARSKAWDQLELHPP